MADKPRPIEFGKRRPALPPDAAPTTAPIKRSHHVALLMFGAFAVGGGAYLVTLRQNCERPSSPGLAAPAPAQTAAGATSCSSGIYSGHGGGHGSSHFSFFGGSSSSGGSIGGSESSSGVSRGGFGAFAHAFGFGGG